MAELLSHLQRGMAEPFARPHADCCAFAADWVLACTGVDPAAPFRGGYASAREARRILRRAGGFLAVWRAHMARAGFAETEAPREGDVGVVRDAAGQRVAAIRVHGGWAAKTTDGLTIADFPTLLAWRIPRSPPRG